MRMSLEELRALAQRADRAFRVDEEYAVAIATEFHRRVAVIEVPDTAREARRARGRAYYHARQAAKREAARARQEAAGEA